MKYYKNKSHIIITEKIPVAVSASKRKNKRFYANKRFYTYRVTIPKLFLMFLIKNNYDWNKNYLTIVPKNQKEYYLTNAKNMMQLTQFDKNVVDLQTNYWIKLMNIKSKNSYKITLPKDPLPELSILDEYMETLEKIKDREPIYIYLKLKHDLEKDVFILTFKFNNKYSSDEKVKSFKRNVIF